MHAVIAVAVSYLLGSISFGLVLARLRGVDLRSTGSGNVGATNAARAMGKRWGVLVMLLDALKAVVPLLIGASVFAQDPARDTILAAMAIAAFLGHLYPIFHGFAGGKGVATAAGVLIGGLLAFLLLRWMRRPRYVAPPPPRLPWVVALEELDELRRSPNVSSAIAVTV